MTKDQWELLALEYDEKYNTEPWFVSSDVEADDHGQHLAIRVKKGVFHPKIPAPNVEVKICIFLVDEA